MPHPTPQPNSGPQLTQNPFLGGGRQITATGLSVLGTGDSREDINVQLARSLLLDPDITPTHKARLRGIIAANSPADRRANEAAAAQTRGAITRHSLANPVSRGEAGEIRNQFEQIHGSSVATPFLYQTSLEHEDDANMLMANQAEAISAMTGVSPDSAIPFLSDDPAQNLKVMEFFRKQGQASPAQMSAVTRELARVDKEIEALRGEGPLFTDKGERRATLSTSGLFGGSSQEAVDTQAAAAFRLGNLEAERQDLVERGQGFVTSFDQPESAPTSFDSNTTTLPPPPAPVTVPAAIPKFSATEPYTLQPTDDISVIARAAQEHARRTGTPVLIIDPATKKVYEIK